MFPAYKRKVEKDRSNEERKGEEMSEGRKEKWTWILPYNVPQGPENHCDQVC